MKKISKSIINALFLFLLTSALLLFGNCKSDPNNGYSDIPDAYVYFTLNLDLPNYNELNIPGGHFYLNNEGYNGIIIYHNIDDTYVAFERTCTYQPLNECSTITVDESGIYMRCGHYDGSDFIQCCGSTFDMSGFVLKNPALYPLKRYVVTRQGNVLTISN